MIEANNIDEFSLVVREADRVMGLRDNVGRLFVKRESPNKLEEIPF